MPRVVLDTSVSLPATLSPTGLTRKLWVLLAHGALTHRVEQQSVELDALRFEAQRTDARLDSAGQDAATGLAERQRVLRELLPLDAPADWVAAGSAALFDECERKVREIGRRLNPSVRESDVAPLRRQVETICVAAAPPFDPAQAPPLTRDRRDDPILYTALLADADYLLARIPKVGLFRVDR